MSLLEALFVKKHKSVSYPQDKGDETLEELLGKKAGKSSVSVAKNFKPVPPVKKK